MTNKDHLTIAKELSAELFSKAEIYTYQGSGLSACDIDELKRHFMPKGLKNCKSQPCTRDICPSRCAEAYWSDHGRLTKMLMERLALKIGGDIELYGTTGLIHDLDYLRHPHDRGIYVGRHPIPLVKYLMRRNANPYMCLAILEHAPHLKLNNLSRLSFSLTGCEELATLISFNESSKIASLSAFAKELIKDVEVCQFVDVNVDGVPRVFESPEHSINAPLKTAESSMAKA